MHALILKLISHGLNAVVMLLKPPKTNLDNGLKSSRPSGAVNTPPSRQPQTDGTSTMASCEWSLACEDPITGEPRGLVFTSAPLTEDEALAYARAILTTYRVLGTFFRHPQASPFSTEGLYLFSYTLGRIKKLASIWAHSKDDAINTLGHMALTGNLLCCCEPDS